MQSVVTLALLSLRLRSSEGSAKHIQQCGGTVTDEVICTALGPITNTAQCNSSQIVALLVTYILT